MIIDIISYLCLIGLKHLVFSDNWLSIVEFGITPSVIGHLDQPIPIKTALLVNRSQTQYDHDNNDKNVLKAGI